MTPAGGQSPPAGDTRTGIMMSDLFQQTTAKLAKPLTVRSRVLVFLAFLALVPTFFAPLWHMTFLAQQYPEGLNLYIYSHNLIGGDDGNDLTEINVLNHYIGMAELQEEDFTEFKWIPLIVGLLVVLALRSVAIGTLSSVVDIGVFFLYFALFSMWRFWYMLYNYGHNLDPKAAVKVEPFMPPLFGTEMVGQFTVTSLPSTGSIFFFLFLVLLTSAIYVTYRQQKKSTV
ncbi:MAG: hypothetical protein KAJ12_05325 [Bacteroidetes bacterium]|nr:hypothetical protein [Bacteroidota bacterium]